MADPCGLSNIKIKHFWLDINIHRICVEYVEFVWHDEKSKTNLTKHRVGFHEAKSVFSDEFARLEHDPDHSKDEDRFALLGVSSLLKLLVVIHVEIEEDIILIISARKATRKEGQQYRRLKS